MRVVYLFCETASIRIPFLGYDPKLFRSLAVQGDGVWDKTQREFIFGKKLGAAEFCRIIRDIPCVWVEKTSPVQVRLFGFWERPWKNPVSDYPGSRGVDNPSGPLGKGSGEAQNLPADFAMTFPNPLLDKFSEHWRIKLETELRSRKYSPRTLRSYVYFNSLLCRTLQKTPEEIHTDDITRFLADAEKNREYSASSMNLAISAIKFFYINVLKNGGVCEQYRPRHDNRLPVILAKTEISRILSMEKNPKHKLLLMLVYSSGLRVSEVVALKREHIDLARKVIYIRQGKGRKDRCTLLSEKAARFITEYCAFYGIQTWLFPGQPATRSLTIRSAQYIFDKAVRRAEIPKKISIHSLRHAFATHLLEGGTDIRYIQALLGHANLRTTVRYAHVTCHHILRIQSPLDTIS